MAEPITIASLLPEHWPAVARIYEEGMASGNATFETEVPTWAAWDASPLPDLRVGALVANPPVVDMGRYMEAWVGADVYGMSRDIRPEDVAGVPEDLMPRQMQWGIEAICTRFGVPSFHAWRDAMADYRLGELLGAVTCPVLALVGGREGDEPRAQFDSLVAGVTGPVTSRVFGPADGASAHCQSDNLRLSAQVTFDWLDDQMA